MKSIEELKEEQYDLKAKLHEMVEFINSKEYFELSPREKGLVSQQRAGMEMYLNALTNRVYSKDSYSFDSSSLIWPMLFGSMLGESSGFNSPCSTDIFKEPLKESDFEVSEEKSHEE